MIRKVINGRYLHVLNPGKEHIFISTKKHLPFCHIIQWRFSMIKKILSAAGAGLVLLSMAGCNLTGPAANSSLIGTWNMTQQIISYSTGDKDTNTASAFFSNKYKFSDDYSLSGTTVVLGISINFSGTWSEKADTVTMNMDVMGTATTAKSQFSVSGNELTLTSSKLENSTTKTTVEKYTKQ